MSKIIFILLAFMLVFQNLLADNSKYNSCLWDNEEEIPCLEIKGNIYNTSEHSKKGINRLVITKSEIEEIGASDLIDVLKSSPNINITQSGPKGQQASLFMRGTGSNHTLVLINGIPINDQSSTQGLHDFGQDFIQTIQQIEVYPGSSATLFGTNAIGGAVNIIMTGDYKDTYSVTSDIDKNYEFFSNKTFIQNNSSLNLKIGSVRNKTISARGNKNDEKDGLINYSTNKNYENYLKYNSRFFNNLYLRQTKTEYDNSTSNQYGYKGDNIMGTIQMGLENKTKESTNKYILYYNSYDREYDERGTIDSYESDVIGLKYDLSKILNDKISFGAGSEYKYDWGYFDNNGSYQSSTKGHSDNFSIYGNVGWNIFKNTNFSMFGRNDNHKQTGNNRTYRFNLNKTIMSTNIGFAFMKGLRNPTLYELYGTDNFGYSGNRNLKPEKSNTIELYSNMKINKNINLSIRGFKSNIKNNIEYINNKYRNDADDVDLNQSGLNVNSNFNFKDLKMKLYSSFLSSEKENESAQLRRPEKNYGLQISKNFRSNKFGEYKLNILYNHYGKHFDTHSKNFNTIEMNKTEIVDIKLEKKEKNVNYFIKVTNLFDENFERPHGYNQEGRILKIGFKY